MIFASDTEPVAMIFHLLHGRIVLLALILLLMSENAFRNQFRNRYLGLSQFIIVVGELQIDATSMDINRTAKHITRSESNFSKCARNLRTIQRKSIH